MYPRRDSNPHVLRHQILSLASLPKFLHWDILYLAERPDSASDTKRCDLISSQSRLFDSCSLQYLLCDGREILTPDADFSNDICSIIPSNTRTYRHLIFIVLNLEDSNLVNRICYHIRT